MIDKGRLFNPVTGDDLIGREEYVTRFLKNFRNIDKWIAQQYALIGPRRVGKTSILREVFRRLFYQRQESDPIPIWIDMQELLQEPDVENFPRNYCKAFAAGYLNYELFDEPKYHWRNLSFDDIIAQADKIGDTTLKETVNIIERLYNEGEYPSAVAIRAVREIGEKEGKKFAVFVDEVQECYQIKEAKGIDITASFKGSFECICVLYLFTGSAVRMMSTEIFGAYAPMHGRVSQIHLGPLEPDKDFELMKKLTAETSLRWEKDSRELLNELTNGYPFYTLCVVLRLLENTNRVITKEIVNNAFAEELWNGEIHQELLNRTTAHLKQVGELSAVAGMLMAIVNAEDKAEMEEVKEADGYSEEILIKLWMADLIEINGMASVVWVKDPVYKTWLRDMYFKLFYQELEEDVVLEGLRRTIARLTNDAERLFKSKIRNFMWCFKGESLDGRFFGYPDKKIQVPFFKRIPQRMCFTSEVSEQNYELDIAGFYDEEPIDAHGWFVECKYRVAEATIDEIEKLIKKADEYSKTYPRKVGALWFVTKERLPEPVQTFAKEKGVYFSSEADVEELLNELWNN